MKPVKIIKDVVKPKGIPLIAMEPLQFGVIVSDGCYKDHIVMRTALRDTLEVIDLSEPRADGCWDSSPPNLKVEILPAGTKLEITI